MRTTPDPDPPRLGIGAPVQDPSGRVGTVTGITGSWAEVAWADGRPGETTTEWLPGLLPAPPRTLPH